MNLHKRIKDLQNHEPADSLWDNIASQLDRDDVEKEKLRHAVSRLPQYEPPTQVFVNIEKKLYAIEEEDKKLKIALAKLTQYEPPIFIFDTIEKTLDATHTEDEKLKIALSRLKQYEPPTVIFSNIGKELDSEAKEHQKLKVALANLKTYEPPTEIWDEIEPFLPKRTAKIVSLFSISRLSAAAAVVGLVLTVGLYFYATTPRPDSTSIAYSQEIINNETLKNNTAQNQEDEAAFAMVNQICEQQAFICEQPEVKNLKSTLEELNAAHSALKESIGAYGNDPDMQQKLQAIDLERTEVLKKIMNYI